MKKTMALVLVIMMLFSFNALADTLLGTLNFWYSNAPEICHTIGRWTTATGTINIYSTKLNSNASFPYTLAIDYGINQWEPVTGIQIVPYSSQAANIMFCGGTRNEIQTYMGVTFGDEVNGTTWYTSKIVEGSWTYGNTVKRGYAHIDIRGCIVDKAYNTTQHYSVATHEFGHVMGWHGHASNSFDIMYGGSSTVTQLTYRDINYLQQIY